MNANYLKLLPVALVLLSLGACNQDSGPGPEIHDTKYVIIGPDGQPTGGTAGENDCVLDQFIGLTWEIKSDLPGLRDWRNTYTWYNPDESWQNELDYRGTSDGGECAGSDCDTTAFVNAVNEAGYCGHSDWRIPSRDELGSISDPRKQDNKPTTNMKIFPHMQLEEYWSGNDYQFQYDSAWRWNFKFGHDRVDWKLTPGFIRLVRGEATMMKRVKD
jgi:hypothetical protein